MPILPKDKVQAAIAQSLWDLLDPEWYAKRYADVSSTGMNPLRHYLTFGVPEKRNPNRWFDCAWYAEHYPEAAASGRDPVIYYLQVGAAALHNPHPHFDAAWYVAQHPEAAGNPLLFHMRTGRQQDWPTERPPVLADYLPSIAPLPVAPADVTVDVVIPVYRGLAETQACLDSVLADPDRPPGRVIVIDDRSPEPALSAWLDRLAKAGRIVLKRNRRNLGFVASCNRGMAEAGRADVVLLNSDTQVPAGWLARLAGHAYSGPDIASVSPFSNNATICGYPDDVGGAMPLGLDLATLDAACQAVNAGRRVALPTTVGFCMYIRRVALDAVGAFDPAAFGRGYGEENDFCRRAAAAGWRHVLACDTFVYHRGEVSFGADKAALAERAGAELRRRYPDYGRLIDAHVLGAPAGPARFAVTAELFRRSGKPTILLIAHDKGGGVRRQYMALVEQFADQANFLLLVASDVGDELSVPALPRHPRLVLPVERLDDLLTVLRGFAVTRAHVHHLMGIDLDVPVLLHRLGVPFDVTVHDYYTVCPQVNLLPWPQGPYCGEPDVAACNACISALMPYEATDIVTWRSRHAWLFLAAERVFCPSQDARDRLTRLGFGEKVVVVPHEPVAGGAWRLAPPPLRAGETLRIAVLGVLARHKGALVVATVADAADPAVLAIHLIGEVEHDVPQADRARLHITGRYQEAELAGLLAQVNPHVVWFPAIWPETYSYTLSTAIDANLPIVATRIGAFTERLVDRPLTWLVDPLTPTAGWLAVFDQVRQALQANTPVAASARAARPSRGTGAGSAAASRSGRAAPPRAPVADYYAPHYLPPPAPPKPGRIWDLRQPGRTRVLLIPERLGDEAGGPISPCAYIRLIQPLDQLAGSEGIDLILADLATALLTQADVIVTHRYAIPSQAAADALARHARATGAVLLYDLDDDLLSIPRDHPEAAMLRPKAKLVQHVLGLADVVWVSTQVLAQRLATLRNDVVVVPNGLDERIWSGIRMRDLARPAPVRLLYMGTATHDAELDLIMPALYRIKFEFADHVQIDLLGVSSRPNLPLWIERPTLTRSAAMSYPGFVNWFTMQEPGWDIGLAPLVDSPFARSKSAIKTLDYAALRMAVLASDVGPYRGSLADGPGATLVGKRPEDWYAAISWLLRDPVLRRERAEDAYRRYLATGTLAAQADMRRAAWRDVVGLKRAAEPVSPRHANGIVV